MHRIGLSIGAVSMGKGLARHGFKSGVLPVTRSILKNPTTKQEAIIAKVNAPKPKGPTGVGYAEGVAHPKKSHREPSPVKFLDVEEVIHRTAAAPSSIKNATTSQQETKLRKAELRRQYLSEAFRQEERRLISLGKLMEEKKEALEKEKQAEIALLNQTRSSDLTIPTLEGIMEGPMMRTRTPEEKKLHQMKRQYNRELMEFKAKERKLEDLLHLYHVSNEFIVTESQLLKKIDEAFANEGSDVLRTRLSMGASRIRSRNESSIGDALFGTMGAGEHVGFPLVKEFLSGEMKDFADQVETKTSQVIAQKKSDVDTILQS